MKQRPIKFRCWDGEQMVSPDYITRNGRGGWLENSIPTGSDKLMQFTGETDKNGIDIYEGDIIRRIVNGETRNTRLVEFEFVAFEPLNSFSMFEEWEVIGNIWENPELLEKR